MARQKYNVVMKGVTGKIHGLLLFKQYSYGTVISKIPDRSKVVLSEKQKSANRNFLRAVKYAKQIINDPVKCAEYKSRLPEGKTVYHSAIAEFLSGKTSAAPEEDGTLRE